MTQKEYTEFARRYVEEQTKVLQGIGLLQLPFFKTFSFSNQDINNETAEKFLNDLIQMGIGKRNGRVLYYFKINNEVSASAIANLITQLKSGPNKKEYALPRVNKITHDNNPVLYVGKTDKDFLSRFKQHLGFGSPSTYALHLVRWSDQLPLDLELNFAIFDDVDMLSLEHVESVLHYALKPILGRSGH